MLYERRRFCSKRCAGLASNPRTPDNEFKARYRQITTPDGRKVLEHRWVMEQVLGRPLLADEQVHHKNHNRLDNRPENLEVVTSAEHGLRHTVHPTTKACAVCGETFTPHKTKRLRAKTCGPACALALRSERRSA
jgi:ribosomal protein L34